MSEEPPFRVEPTERGFRVVDGDGRAVMECRDEHSAQHYLVLVNKAWKAGYKAGWREAREA